jgi:hypothetical protein
MSQQDPIDHFLQHAQRLEEMQRGRQPISPQELQSLQAEAATLRVAVAQSHPPVPGTRRNELLRELRTLTESHLLPATRELSDFIRWLHVPLDGIVREQLDALRQTGKLDEVRQTLRRAAGNDGLSYQEYQGLDHNSDAYKQIHQLLGEAIASGDRHDACDTPGWLLSAGIGRKIGPVNEVMRQRDLPPIDKSLVLDAIHVHCSNRSR